MRWRRKRDDGPTMAEMTTLADLLRVKASELRVAGNRVREYAEARAAECEAQADTLDRMVTDQMERMASEVDTDG